MRIESIKQNRNNGTISQNKKLQAFQSVHINTKNMNNDELSLIASCLKRMAKIVGDKLDVHILKLAKTVSEPITNKALERSNCIAVILTPVAKTIKEQAAYLEEGLKNTKANRSFSIEGISMKEQKNILIETVDNFSKRFSENG